MSSYINSVCEISADRNDAKAKREVEENQKSLIPPIALGTIAALGTLSCPPEETFNKTQFDSFAHNTLDPTSKVPQIEDPNFFGYWSKQSMRMMYKQFQPRASVPQCSRGIDKLHHKWFDDRLSIRPVSFMFYHLSKEIPSKQIEEYFTAYALDQIEKGRWRYKPGSKYLDAANATQVFLLCEEFMLAFQSGRTVSLHRDLKNVRDQKCILLRSQPSKTVRINAVVKTIQEQFYKATDGTRAKKVIIDFQPHNPIADASASSDETVLKSTSNPLAKLDWYYTNYPLPIDALMSDIVFENGQKVRVPVSQEIKEFYQKAIEQIEAPGLQDIQKAARDFILRNCPQT